MENFYPFLAYVLVTSFTPGPNNILSMSNAMQYGYRKTLKFLLGIIVGFGLIMLLSGLLNVFLVQLLPQVEIWLKILGAIYMAYLAVHISRSKPVEDGDQRTNLNTFIAGFTLQFLNLKVILYGITVYSTFIVQSYQTPIQVSLFALLLMGVGFLAISSWAVGGAFFRNFLYQNYRLFNYSMAALLIYTAVASLL